MAPRTKPGSQALGSAIQSRRLEIGLSVEGAAIKAGVESKTWSRYEAGSAIRVDKIRGVCRALGWSKLPDTDDPEADRSDRWLDEVGEDHPAWSRALEQFYGRACAVTFAVGSDLLIDSITEDLEALARQPRWTHVGQLEISWIGDMLPPQFRTRYDYEFMYSFKWAAESLRKQFTRGKLEAHSVIEKLALYHILRQAEELSGIDETMVEAGEEWRDWAGDILGDLDIELFLFFPEYLLTPDSSYHFDRWQELPFWLGEHTEPSAG